MKGSAMWLAALLAALRCGADVPQLINYQGRLLSGTNLINGSVGLSLRLFDMPSGGTPEYEDSNSVTVVDGLYSTYLGDNTIRGSLAAALTNSQVWLEVAVDGTALSPRERVAAVAYARTAAGVPEGAILSSMLEDGAITSAKLANGAIGTAKLAAGAVGTGQLALAQTDARYVNATGDAMAGPLTNAAFFIAPRYHNSGNDADPTGAFALGGANNAISNVADYGAIGGGQDNGIGAGSASAAIAGGERNRIGPNADRSAIGGGFKNVILANTWYGVIAGGDQNQIGDDADFAAIGGGYTNVVGDGARYGAVAGGTGNRIGAGATHGFVGSGWANQLGDNGQSDVIGGGTSNRIGAGATNCFIGGGWVNEVGGPAFCNTIGGGWTNRIAADTEYCVIGGGWDNAISRNASYATIAGGWDNAIGVSCPQATIGGGGGNHIDDKAYCSTIAGGSINQILTGATYAAIAGGFWNRIGTNAEYAAIGGGEYCAVGAGATYAFAAGRQAQALHAGSFVWADSQDKSVASTASNQVTFRCLGGVRFTSGATGLMQTVAWVPGGGSWTFTSDAAAKDLRGEVDTAEVLARVTALPLYDWSYRGYAQRHIGPTAQDFHRAFPLNDDDRSINSLDLDGVALAAVQALARQNDELRAELKAVRGEVETLRKRLDAATRISTGPAL